MDTTTNSPVRFGVFELDPCAGELRRNGRRVALQPQPLEVLRALIERPGEVVTREELRRRVWSNGAYVDFDRSLTKAIVKLRDALGDDAESPRYIETLPRHGYRFIPLPEAHVHVDVALQAEAASTANMARAQGPASPEPELSPISTVQSTGKRQKWGWAVLGIAVLTLPAWLIGSWFRAEAPSHPRTPANIAPTRAVTFAPPPHSVAVLPFVNLSGDSDQEYFSDGLTEELLDSLARTNELRIAGGTSTFYFKGKDVDLVTIAHRLNVAAVLDGSVRRAAHTVRITARLTDALTGFNLWSATYDRDLSDILGLQSEIANAVAAALKVKLLGNSAARIELGGTRNPAAFDAYLRASKIYWSSSDNRARKEAVAGFAEAVAQDPDYALARVAHSIALLHLDAGATRLDNLEAARAEALKAAQLAPELADSHLALALVAEMSVDPARSEREFERALALAPGSERILRDYAERAAEFGQVDSGIAAARRAVELSPLNPESYWSLAVALEGARRYDEAIAALNEGVALAPPGEDLDFRVGLGHDYFNLGNFERSRSECEIGRERLPAQVCLATTYEKLSRHRDAQAELVELRASAGDAEAYLYAEIYAQWGRPTEALEWLDTAVRVRHPGLMHVKNDPLLDPLRKEPRFQAILRELKSPD